MLNIVSVTAAEGTFSTRCDFFVAAQPSPCVKVKQISPNSNRRPECSTPPLSSPHTLMLFSLPLLFTYTHSNRRNHQRTAQHTNIHIAVPSSNAYRRRRRRKCRRPGMYVKVKQISPKTIRRAEACGHGSVDVCVRGRKNVRAVRAVRPFAMGDICFAFMGEKRDRALLHHLVVPPRQSALGSSNRHLRSSARRFRSRGVFTFMFNTHHSGRTDGRISKSRFVS